MGILAMISFLRAGRLWNLRVMDSYLRLTLAHLALCAAAIFFLAAALIFLRFLRPLPAFFEGAPLPKIRANLVSSLSILVFMVMARLRSWRDRSGRFILSELERSCYWSQTRRSNSGLRLGQ